MANFESPACFFAFLNIKSGYDPGMKKCVFILICILFYTRAIAQDAELVWVKQMGGTSFEEVQAITMDTAGNIYCTGYFSATVDFDPGPGIFNLTAVEDEDVFVSKMDSAGNLLWVKQFGGTRHQSGTTIAIDAAGNVLIGGIFFGHVDFDPGPGTLTFFSNGFTDNFICKLDTNGDLVWARQIAGSLTDRLSSIAFAGNGSILITGYFEGTSDFDPGSGFATLTSAGVADIFILRLSAAGLFEWVKQIGGESYDAGYSLKTDAAGNIYVCGIFLNIVDFDPGIGVHNVASVDQDDVFILKLDNNADFVWVKQIGGNSYSRVGSLSIDLHGNVIVAGNFVSDCDFDPGPGTYNITADGNDDAFIVKLDSNGIFRWARALQGPDFQRPYQVVTDNSDDVYTIGYFGGVTDFDPGPAVYNISAVGNLDIFLSKLNKNGDFIWVKQFGGSLFESGNAVYVDNSKYIYAAGYFRGTVDFNPNAATYNLTSNGIDDIFIHKMKQCPAFSTLSLSITTCNSYTLNGQVFTSTGNYTQVLRTTEGCDSVVISLQLTINRIITNANAVICEGETFLAGGFYQTVAGTYYDTLLTNNGCDSVVATRLTVKPAPKPRLGADRNLCFGDSVVLYAGSFSNYLWQDGSTLPSFTANRVGKYWVRIMGTNQCPGSDTFNIMSIDTLPRNFLLPVGKICAGSSLLVSVTGDYKNYLWSDRSTASSLIVLRPGVYQLSVTDNNNCMGADSITILKKDCIPTGIPNSFTPNRDANNDIFKPVINQVIQNYYFVIFNRHGQKVFETYEYGQGWDGRLKNKEQPVGTYVYRVKFTNGLGRESVENGSVLLIR